MIRNRAPVIVLLFLSACSSPNPNFYALYPEAGGAAPGVALQIELRRPGLPGYLDRPNLVRRVETGRLDISGTERWGTSLGEMVGATFADNLTQRLPESSIYTEAGTISAEPDVVIELELQRFEPMPGGEIRLDAQVALHFPGSRQASFLKRYELEREAESGGAGGAVAAMSSLLAQLAGEVAREIVRRAPARRDTGALDTGGEAPPPPAGDAPDAS